MLNLNLKLILGFFCLLILVSCTAELKPIEPNAGPIGTKEPTSAPITTEPEVLPTTPNTCFVKITGTKCGDGVMNKYVVDEWGMANNSAGTSESGCFSRGQEFFDWCTGSQGVFSSITMYFVNSNQKETVTQFSSLTNNCMTTLIGTSCGGNVVNFELPDYFSVRNRNSGTDQAACFARGKELYDWCKTHPNNAISAVQMRFGNTGATFQYP